MGPRETPPAETRRAIMEATYRAMCSVGYAGLTMSAIADEFEKSQSLIHYHYDTKEALLTAFLEYLIEGFLEKIDADESRPPMETLTAIADALLVGPAERAEFNVAMLELRARAPYEDAYREQFLANDTHLRGLIADVVVAVLASGPGTEADGTGTDAGDEGPDVDPDEFAHRLLVTVEGARTRRAVLGDEDALRVGRAMVEEQLDTLSEAST